MARSLYSEANTRLSAVITLGRPRMLRKVSCCPAKDASGMSSAVALERTATDTAASPSVRARYASAISDSRRLENSAVSIQPRISSQQRARSATSSGSSPSSLAAMRPASPPCARNSRKASAVVAKPPGTRIPACESCEIISPSEAFLPPTCSTSVIPSRSKFTTYLSPAMTVLPHRLKDLVETAILHFMPDRRRTVFFVSDGTGITVEMLGHSLLTQFDGVESTHETIPFVDSVGKAQACVARIDGAPRPAGLRPVVFTTLVNADIRETVRKADAFVLDFFESFLDPLEAEFGSKSTHTVGRSTVW